MCGEVFELGVDGGEDGVGVEGAHLVAEGDEAEGVVGPIEFAGGVVGLLGEDIFAGGAGGEVMVEGVEEGEGCCCDEIMVEGG